MPNVTSRQAPAITTPAFAGRDADLAELTAKLRAAPAVILIEGEAGIGKTRLITEYLAESKQNALVATCPAFRTPQTLGPLTDALRHATPAVGQLKLTALAGALRPLFPEWAADLPADPGPAEDASAARHRLFRALHELIGAQGPGLVVLDDAQWADDATLEFLLFLAADGQQRIVVSTRPEDMPETSLVPRLARRATGWIMLRALDIGGTAAMVTSMLGAGHVSQEFAGFVHEHAGGVPVAVEELVRLLAAREDIRLRNGRWTRRELPGIVVPPHIRGSVLERVARLGADAQAVVAAVAVAGEPVSEPVVAAICELDAERVVAGLSETLTSSVLAEDGNGLIRLRHALAAQAVYESVPGPRRRLLHRRAARALERLSPPPAPALARHFRAAGDVEGWRRYAEQAADLAMAAGDQAGAAAMLFELVTGERWPASTLAELTNKISLLALPGDGELSKLAQVLRTALRVPALSAVDEAELRFQLGRVLTTMKVADASRAELGRAVAGLPPGSVRSARAMMLLGWPDGAIGAASEHLRWLRQAAAQLDSIATGERLRFRVDLASGLLLLGEEDGWAEAATIPWQPAVPAERLQVMRGHGNLGEVAILWGRYPEARRRLTHAVELAGCLGYSRLREMALVALARLDWFTGAWDGLTDQAEELAAGENLPEAGRLHAVMVSTASRAAQGEEDASRLARAIADFGDHGSMPDLAEPVAELARLYRAAGDPVSALQVTEGPLETAVRTQTWLWAAELMPVRVAALTDAHRMDEAASLVAAFSESIVALDAPAVRAAQALCGGFLAMAQGLPEAAGELFARSAEAFTSMPRPYAALLATEQYAQCLLAAGKHQSGLRELTAAADGLHQLGARGDLARVTKLLAEQGGKWRLPGTSGRPGYGSELSPREAEVVTLVAAGLTNRQIAASLVVSRQTVASHVHSALRKFGVSSRTALAVAATGRGIVGQAGDEKTPRRTGG